MIQSTNRDEMPEAGRLAAIPIVYPVDRPVVARRVVRKGVPQKLHPQVAAVKKSQTPIRASQSKPAPGKVAAGKPVVKAAAHRPGA